MSALFDFPSLLLVLLLIICTMTYLRSMYPKIFDTGITPAASNELGGTTAVKRTGVYGICWKASRIGERLSPYIAACCVAMAIHVLFIKA